MWTEFDSRSKQLFGAWELLPEAVRFRARLLAEAAEVLLRAAEEQEARNCRAEVERLRARSWRRHARR